jgi:hypothetical protein
LFNNNSLPDDGDEGTAAVSGKWLVETRPQENFKAFNFAGYPFDVTA